MESLFDLLSEQDKAKLSHRSYVYPYTTSDFVKSLKSKNFVMDLTVKEAMSCHEIFGIEAMNITELYELFGK
jgi:hypothetical protein